MKIEGWRARVRYKIVLPMGDVSCNITMLAALANDPTRIERLRFGATGRTASDAFNSALAMALREVISRKAWKKNARKWGGRQ